MNNAPKFEAKHTLIKDLLFSHARFQVPRYQRPFAWGGDEVTQFWEDICSNEDPYFLGSFIFNTHSLGEDDALEIIDGQQRLLTMTIFCAVLRDLVMPIDQSRSDLFQRKDIAQEDLDGRCTMRIRPADSIAEFFEAQIQKPDGSPLSSSANTKYTKEEQRVLDAYRLLHGKVSEELRGYESNEAKLDRLSELRRRVAELLAIRIDVAREEDAYEIFESTNAKGMELTVADLLKNLVFKRLKAEEGRDTAKEIWQEITTNVESTDTELKKFIRYFWISKYAFITDKQLYKAIRAKVTDWQALLWDLSRSATLFNLLLEGDISDFSQFKRADRIHKSLEALRFMRVSQCYVLFLAILRNYDVIGTDPSRIFDLVERFTYQYSVVCKMPGNRPEKIYSKYALLLEKVAAKGRSEKTTKEVQQLFEALEKDLTGCAPSKQVFTEAFMDVSYANSDVGRPLMKYVLSKFNDHFRKSDEQRIDFSHCNIEHVLPQKPQKESGLDKKDIRQYVHKLGNLTLLSTRINSKVSNSAPHAKLDELHKSELAITHALVRRMEASAPKWGQTQIMERQAEFAELAYTRIWTVRTGRSAPHPA